MEMPLITFLLPAYNEGENIHELYEQLVSETKDLYYSFEYLFIDDGSTDDTLDKIKYLAFYSDDVRYVSFSRNFGKEAAMYAGLKHAKGEAVIIMDTDLQHPSHLIPSLIKGYEAGYHQVIAKRNRKGESRCSQFFTRSFYQIMNKWSDVALQNGEGDFRLLSRKAVNALLSLSEGNRFSKGLYSWIGLSQTTVTYENVLRENGKSKWKFSSLLSYALDGMLSFNTKPLRLCCYLGLITILMSFIYIFITFLSIIRNGVEVPGYFTTISAVLFLGGVQLFCLGIIGEYIGRIYNETKKRPHYILEESNTTDPNVEVREIIPPHRSWDLSEKQGKEKVTS
ncbi:glycosyltransferase family 2 protein [Oceanobacillus senegalensis]|uniref:glycosyltransferase family 2 protein n=1 Tax=Oceanobacillus senegalensis TaxID=1936063 RepID=UPI000A30FEA6|nr:glycosyltransferase family 2 protein [Oceanobacillus senegalensis]